MAAYRLVDGSKSPAGWLPVDGDQLRAQRSVSSTGSLHFDVKKNNICQNYKTAQLGDSSLVWSVISPRR